MTVSSNDGPLPPDTEARLGSFTELVATAIANTEAREALAELADEQAALRRVATLVQRESARKRCSPPSPTRSPASSAWTSWTIDRYDTDSSTVIASLIDPGFPVGSRWPFEGTSLGRTVYETGRPARFDDYFRLDEHGSRRDPQPGLHRHCRRPIIVEGRIWGVICVAASARPLPADTEERLVQFTELVATAIANAEGRAKLAQSEARALELAREQAALRRVATLVAQDTAPAEIFAAVSAEVDHVFRLDPATGDIAVVNRFEGPEHVVVGVSKSLEGVPIGSRWRPDTLFVGTPRPSYGTLGAHSRRGRRVGRRRRRGVPPPAWLSLASRQSDRGRRPSLGGDVGQHGGRPPARHRGAARTLHGARCDSHCEDRRTRGAARAADEQATLRRLATLIAQEAELETVFAKVAEDVARTLGDVDSALWRDDGDRTMTAVAVRGPSDDALGVRAGTRLTLDGDSVIARVLREGRPQRIDDFLTAGRQHRRARAPARMRSAIGCPIAVGPRTWGVMTVATYGAVPFAPETETRLARFGDLVGTAIANAESRDALARLADEQAGLRRVATLVARAAPPGEVFDAVAMEVGKLLDADITVVGRYDADGSATAIGSWSSAPGEVPVGTRSAIGGRNVLTLVAETKRPARVDGYEEGSGQAAEIARRYGWRSSIAAPISVDGRLWGVMLVATKRAELFPSAAEERLSAFTDLVATALANAQAQDELRRYADEQASLQRVATRVAEGMPPARSSLPPRVRSRRCWGPTPQPSSGSSTTRRP